MMSASRGIRAAVVAGFVVVATVAGFAQTPTAPVTNAARGRGGFPLPALPGIFETFQQKIRVSVVARGLPRPWSLLILPDGDMLVSMRNPSEVWAIRKGVLDPKPLAGMPQMSRMFDLAMHPKFGENKWIYFGYAKPLDEKTTAMAVARGRYDGAGLSNVQDLYVSHPVGAGG